MEEKEIIELTFRYSLRTIEKCSNPCKHCALCSGGGFFCLNRKSCKYTDETPLVYYFEGVK